MVTRHRAMFNRLELGPRLLGGGVVFCLAIIVTIWAAVDERASWEREEALQAAKRQDASLVFAFEQYSLRILRNASAVTQFIENAYLRPHDETDLGRILAERVAANDFLEVMAVFDAGGLLVATSEQRASANISIADQEEFLVHASGTGPKLYVGKTGVTPLWREVAIPVTRRIVLADGSFGGVVMVLVRPGRFTGFYDDSTAKPDDVIMLAGLDGTVRVRKTGGKKTYGEDLVGSAMLAQQARKSDGAFRDIGKLDGLIRLFAYRTLKDYSVVVVVSSVEGDVIRESSQRKLLYERGAAAGTAVIVLFAIVVIAVVSRAHRATIALKKNEEQFRSLNELSTDWWWEQDAEFRFIDIAGMAMSYGNIVADDFLGHRRWELPNLQPLNFSWDAHRAALDARLPFNDLSLKYTDREGNENFESVSGRPIFDTRGNFRGYRGVGTDVTEKMKTEQALRQSEARFRNLVELSSDWYWEQDDQFRYTFMSHGRQRIIDVDIAESLGKTRWELGVQGPTAEQWAEHRRLLEAHLPFRNFEYHWITADGSLFNISISGDPVFDESGRFTGYRGTGSNITQRKRFEAEIVAVNTALEDRVILRTEQLERANDDLRALGYSIAHDMRAPLRAIGGFSTMLLENHLPQLDAAGKALFSRVLTNVDWMGQLIDGLLALSQLSMAPLLREPIDLPALSREIFAELQRLEPDRHVELVLPDMLVIDGDRIMVRRMMQNLIGNAWKYSANEPHARIEIGLEKGADGMPTYFIKDNGAGFDMTYADKLFQAFQRLHSPSEFQGTGIGLAIVSLIVRKHGGRIRAESAVGKGATFYFTFRAAGSG